MIAITDFKLFNESVKIGEGSPLTKHILETDKIILDHWQNDISFQFVALNYNQPEENLYSYKLENFDRNFRSSGNLRSASYTNLDPGDYVFKVIGSNNDGVWNKRGATILITIKPPWWGTIWAYIFYFLLGCSILYLVYRAQHNRVVKRERDRSKIMEAELRAQAAEARSRAIQAENDRKTFELEEARKLQLSMLPKELPQLPYLEIAVHMETATEVGGDYYDFHLDESENLSVLLGDATGHGLKAGTMVSVIKSLFVANSPHGDIPGFFEDCTRTIKKLKMGNLFMALTFLKISQNKLIVSQAGMPPLLIFRSTSGEIEEIIIKSMPLGAFDNYKYPLKNISLLPGDTVLLMSDGLPELFNNKKELYDFQRVKNLFKEIGNNSPSKYY